MNSGLLPTQPPARAATRAAALAAALAPARTTALARPDPTVIAALEAGIRRLGGGSAAIGDAVKTLSLGVAAIDAALPWHGLPRAALHEIVAVDGGVSAIGFAAVLAGRLAGGAGTVVWCRRAPGLYGPGLYGPGLYGPGLAAFGLDPARLVVVRARRESDILWALEEALRSRAPAAVVGEIETDRTTALRRLQLAAETHVIPAILIRPAITTMGATMGATTMGATPMGATPAVTRWRVGAARSAGNRRPRPVWRLDLDRCRGRAATAGPKTWTVEWRDATGDLAVVADVRHRPAAPAANGRPAC